MQREVYSKTNTFLCQQLWWSQFYVHKKENKSQVPHSLSMMTDTTRDSNSSQLCAGPRITKWLVYYSLGTPALAGLFLKAKKVMGYLASAGTGWEVYNAIFIPQQMYQC